MDNKTVRTAGIVAGIVVVLGVLVIGAQYLGGLTGGASAEVIKYDELPNEIKITKDDYVSMKSVLDSYWAASDLATKNQKIKEFQNIFDGLAK